MKKNTSNKRKSPSHKSARPKLEAVTATFIVIGLVFFSTYLVYVKSVDSLEEEIKIGLKSNVSAAATTINGDVHTLFSATSKREDSLYVSQIVPLEEIRRSAKDIRYIYTNVLIDDKVYFMLNPSPQNDNDNDGIPDVPPALMDEYKDPAPALLKALKEQKTIVSDIYADEWGVFISSYAPFYDSNGQFVGTLGMDLELNNFYERLRPIEIAFEKTVIIIIFIGLVIGLLIWYMRHYTQRLLLKSETDKNEQRNMQISFENTLKENILIVKKIKNNLSPIKKNDITWFQCFDAWISHIIRYQQSKMSMENETLEKFEIEDLVQGIKNDIEKKDSRLFIGRKGDIPIYAFGIPLSLGIELISTLLHFVKKETKSNALNLMISQVDEGVEEITIRLELSGMSHQKINERLYSDINFINTSFEDNEFKITTAINLLGQYQCKATSFSNSRHFGFYINMRLYKSPEA